MTNFLFLAEGFEEIEAVSPVDILRRAGMDIKTVSITGKHQVTGAHGMTVHADLTFKQADFAGAGWLIIPGGMPGASNLHDFAPLNDLLRIHGQKGGNIAAICASPSLVLAPLGLLKGRNATCYPGMQGGLLDGDGLYSTERVVTDGNTVTGNGPSSATLFALEIVARTLGRAKANEVAGGMLL